MWKEHVWCGQLAYYLHSVAVYNQNFSHICGCYVHVYSIIPRGYSNSCWPLHHCAVEATTRNELPRPALQTAVIHHRFHYY